MKIYYRFYCYCTFSHFLNHSAYARAYLWNGECAGRCILAENQDSNVIRQQREAVGRASQNYRHSRIYCLLRESAKHLGDVCARKNFSLLCSFSLVPFSLSAPPSLYAAAHFSDIIACSPLLPRVATGAHENPRNKVAVFPETGFRKCVWWWSFNAVSKTVLQLVKSKGHL